MTSTPLRTRSWFPSSHGPATTNATGWGAWLGDDVRGPNVNPYGAAARLEDFRGLPPAYIEVGELDIFRTRAWPTPSVCSPWA